MLILVSIATSTAYAEGWRSWSDPATVVESRSAEELAAGLVKSRLGPGAKAAAAQLEQAATSAKQQLAELRARVHKTLTEAGVPDVDDTPPEDRIQKPSAFTMAGVDLPSMVLGGLVKFAERRAREESITFLVERLRHKFCDGRVAGESILPSTCALLAGYRHLRSAPPLSLVQRTIRDDIGQLPAHLIPLFEGARSNNKFPVGPAICGLQLGERVRRSVHGSARDLINLTADALETQDCAELLGFKSRDVVDTILGPRRFAALLVAESIETMNLFEVNEAINAARDVLRAATGKIVAELVGAILADVAKERRHVEAVIGRALVAAAASPAVLAKIEALRNDVNRTIATLATLQASVEATVRGEGVTLLSAVEESLGPAARAVLPLVQAIAERRRAKVSDQALAIATAMRAGHEVAAYLFDTPTLSAPNRAALRSLLGAAEAFVAGDFAAGFANLFSSAVIPTNIEPLRSLLEMSELVIGMAGATSSDEIASLLEASVPTGGWRDKRAHVTYGLSAQFGAAGGFEWAHGTT